MTVKLRLAELKESRDLDLGIGRWVEIDQDLITAFAQITGDEQWIHVDEDRARQGPFHSTVAHGYLLASLLPQLLGELLEVTDASISINYGLDRLRFTAPAPSGSKVRVVARLLDCKERAGGVLSRTEVRLELMAHDRPALVATTLTLRYPRA